MATTWVRPPQCTKGDIDRAGRALASIWNSERDEAAVLVNAWRASHNFPLNTFQVNLRYRAQRVNADATVAQRLKRLSSIRSKLQREQKMPLSQMQDLGGCRAIMNDVKSVYALKKQYEDDGHRIRNNYIDDPKPDGYRGIHIIGRYNTDSDDHAVWNGHRIEIQLRSYFQHAFSTAVETVTTFTGQPLKFGGGDPRWRRFFALMAGILAAWENTPSIPGVPDRYADIRYELKDAALDLRVEEMLGAWSRALHRLPPRRVSGAREWLLLLDPETKEIQSFAFRSPKAASVRALALESEAMASGSHLDVVQVSAESIDELRKAYPNYQADTSVFMHALTKAVE